MEKEEGGGGAIIDNPSGSLLGKWWMMVGLVNNPLYSPNIGSLQQRRGNIHNKPKIKYEVAPTKYKYTHKEMRQNMNQIDVVAAHMTKNNQSSLPLEMK